MEILFYVLIPVFGTEDTVGRCLDSLVNQTDQNYRAVIVDDGTPDRAGQICEEYASRYPNFTVLHQENRGIFAARQRAIDYVLNLAADTEQAYLLFLDSDDSFRADTLQCVRREILRTKPDMVFFHFDSMTEDGRVLWSSRKPGSLQGTVTDKKAFYQEVLLNDVYNPLWRKATAIQVFRKASRRQLTPYDYGEDLVRSIPLYEYTEKVSFLPDVLYNYMESPGSVTRTATADNYTVKFHLNRLVWDFWGKQTFWNAQELQAYWNSEAGEMGALIQKVSGLSGAVQQVYGLLDQIRNDPYYRQVRKNSSRNNIWMQLLEKKAYSLLRILVKGKGSLARAYRAWKPRLSVCSGQNHKKEETV